MLSQYIRSNDLFAGFFVSMLALPLCLGISIASGFPPIAGIFTAVFGGIICSVIGGAPLTIKGPAAGLIVVVLGAVQELQTYGDPISGYKRALAVGVVAGVVQIILSRLKFGKIVEMIPHSVIHGMLAAIGIIIIAKQIHLVFGVKPKAGLSNLDLILLVPDSLNKLNPEVFLIGAFSLFAMIGAPALTKLRLLKQVPIPLLIVIVSIGLSSLIDLGTEHDYQLVGHIYHLSKEMLVNVPTSILASITFPDWSMIFSWSSFKYVIMFSLVGSIESLLTVSATESLKPEAKKANHDRDLLATGIANTLVATIGGLPMISEVARSKANIDAGAKSSVANFVHAVLLVIYVLFLPTILAKIPLATLAGMLIYVGMRLASINEFYHAWKIGPEQFLFFITTCVLTIFTDLLVGVFAGLALAVVITVFNVKSVKNLFKVERQVKEDKNNLIVNVTGSATFLNSHQIKGFVKEATSSSRDLIVNFSQAKFVEHTFIKKLNLTKETVKEIQIQHSGLESLKPFSSHPESTRVIIQ